MTNIDIISKNAKLTRDKNHYRKGGFAPGNKLGGRKKGSKNRFTQVKHAIVEVFNEENGKLRLARSIKTDKDMYKFVREIIIPILPKEPMVQNNVNILKVDYGWSNTQSQDQIPAADVPEGST